MGDLEECEEGYFLFEEGIVGVRVERALESDCWSEVDEGAFRGWVVRARSYENAGVVVLRNLNQKERDLDEHIYILCFHSTVLIFWQIVFVPV